MVSGRNQPCTTGILPILACHSFRAGFVQPRCRPNPPPQSPACPPRQIRKWLPCCGSANATTREALIALDTRYAAPPTAIRYTALWSLMALMAVGPRSDFAHHAQRGRSRPASGVVNLVHAGGGGRASRADDFVTHRVNRAHVVDKAVGEVHRQLFRPWFSISVMRFARRRGQSAACRSAAGFRPASSWPLLRG